MNTIKFDDYEKGTEIPELKMGPIGHMDLVRYAGASGDFNPIHTDPEFAKSNAGLDGTIAHGMYVMAQVGRLCTNWVNPKQVESFAVSFKGMTVPGQSITCSGKVKKKLEKDGKKLLTIAVQAVGDDEVVKVAGDLVVNCE